MRYRLIISLIIALMLIFSTNTYVSAASSAKVRVIIGLKSAATASDETPIKIRGGIIGHRFHRVNAISAEVPQNIIPILKALDRVSYVEIDGKVQAVDSLESIKVTSIQNEQVQAASQTIPWGITAVKATDVQAYDQGSGVRVAIIDTGIDLTHPDLQVAGNVNIITASKTGNDDNGHGTHVAGTVAALNNDIGVLGVAPQAQLYAVKVLDSSGSGYWSNIIKGIEWSIDNDMDIINMSLGSTSGSTALQQACDNAYNAGILVVAAAGNNGKTSTTVDNVIYPARYSSVVAVAAVDSSSARASFSSTGPKVELAAPGVSVYSTYKGSTYSTLQGTSMASPHVAGVAALVFASGIEDTDSDGKLNDEVRLRLQQTARDLGASGRDAVFGFGLVNALTAAPNIENRAPVAEAGADQTTFINIPVILDGSASSDADADVLTYSWNQTAGPTVTLVGNTSVHPTFTPTLSGSYTFELVINDGELNSQPDTVIITVRQANSAPGAPVVAITPSAPLKTDTLICNITTNSIDNDGDTVTYAYAWYKNTVLQSGLTSNSVGSSLIKKGETWRCVVTPNDGFLNGPPGWSEVTIGNTPPEANAGADQNAIINTLVTLNGSGSTDIDGDLLTYSWTRISGPVNVTLSSTSAVRSTFTTATAGSYVFQLTVTDNSAASDTDTVTVNISAAQNYNLHTRSVEVSLVDRYNGYRTNATARVTVVDAFGNVVSGVTVTGHWSSATTGNVTGKTSATGQVTFSSATLRYPSIGTTFVFTLDSLSKSGWTYDAGANQQTSGAVQVP